MSHPLSVLVNTFGTSLVPESLLENEIPKILDLSPKGIIDHLQLSCPIYQSTAAYGHFGRVPTEKGEFSWEKVNLVEIIKKKFG